MFLFQGMHYVYAVYKEGSFSKAAASLYISQPSLSAMIKKIEAQAGFTIFDRSTTPIRPTELGMQYIRTVEVLTDVEKSFENYINDINDLKQGTLSIGGTNLFVSYALPPLVLRFTERYPQIHITLTESSTSELTEKLFTGELDLLLDNKHMDPDIYEKVCFHDEHLLLAVPKTFSVNRQLAEYAVSPDDIRSGMFCSQTIPTVPLQLFKEEHFLLLKSGNDTRIRGEKLCRSAHFEPKIRFELDQQSTAYNLTCAGLGISFIGDILIRHVPDNSNVVYYKLDGEGTVRSVNFYYKRNRYLSKATSEFLKSINSVSDAEAAAL